MVQLRSFEIFRENTLEKTLALCKLEDMYIVVADFETNDAEIWLLRKWKRCWKRGGVNIQRKSLSCRWLWTRRNVLLKRFLGFMQWIGVQCAVAKARMYCHDVGISWYVMT